MIKRIASYLLSAQKLRHAIVSTTFINIISKIAMYIRMAVIAYAFGLTVQMDAYNVSMSLMEITVFIFGNSFEVLGIPQLVKALQDKGELYFRRLSGSLFTLSVFATILLVIVTYSFSRNIVNVLVPGFSPDKKNLTCGLLPFFLPMALAYIPYYALSAILKSVKRFRLAIFVDLFITIISLLIVLFYYRCGLQVIPLAFGAAYITGVLIEIFCVYKLSIIRFTVNIFLPEMKIIYRNLFSLSFLFIISQLYRVVDKGFGSLLPTGSISAIGYALVIISTLVTMFSFSGIFLTGFSETTDHGGLFKKSIAMNLFIAVPVTAFLFFNSADLLRLLLKRGVFDESAVLFTGSLLSIYSLILFASLIINIIYSLYQSKNSFMTIIVLSASGLIMNVLLNIILVKPFGAIGIVSATVLSSYFVLIAAMIALRRAHLGNDLLHFSAKNMLFFVILSFPFAAIIHTLPLHVVLKILIYFGLIYLILVLFDMPRPLKIREMAFKALYKT